jgi:hypothetical protein
LRRTIPLTDGASHAVRFEGDDSQASTSLPTPCVIFEAEQSTAKIDDHHGAVERLA